MISEARLTDGSIAAELHGLLQEAYAREATLIGCADFPPLRETVEALRQSADRFLVFTAGEEIAGTLSFRIEAGDVVITRLGVRVSHLRHGIATVLLRHLEEQLPAERTQTVSTAAANLPAVALYQRQGFTSTGGNRSPEGIALLHLRKAGQRTDAPAV